MGRSSIPVRWWALGLMSAGCTTLLGLDEDYVPVGRVEAGGAAGGGEGAGPSGGSTGVGGDVGGTPGSGGTSGSGGADGFGGTSDAGDASGSGGANAAGGTGGTPCTQSEKRCGAVCVTPSTDNGCSLTGCDPCPLPTVQNSIVFCSAEQACVADCAAGFVPSQGQCVQGTGGGGGSGGTSGTGGGGGSGGTGTCDAAACPSCPGVSCCTVRGICGCQHGFPPFVNPYCIGG